MFSRTVGAARPRRKGVVARPKNACDRVSVAAEQLEQRVFLSSTLVDESQQIIGANPSPPVDPAIASQIISYNPATHQTQIEPAASAPKLTEATSSGHSPGFAAPAPIQSVPPPQPTTEVGPPSQDFVFSPDTRTALGAGNMTVFPWDTIGRMWMLWPDGAESSGSGAMVGPRNFLTAGHCVYSAAHGGWASAITFSPGQDGNQINDPYWSNTNFKRSDNQYWGEAAATYYRSYTGWTSSGDWDYDIAVVTLDRNIGNYTGWMGYGYNDNNAFFQNLLMNTAGYPGDLTPTQYDQFYTSDRITTVNTLNLQSNLIDIYPGQSGSPVWYYDGTNRYTYAVVSSEWSSGGTPLYNQFTRINSQRYNDINADKAADGSATDYPDLVSYDEWYNSAFDSHTTSTSQGGHIDISSYIRNIGTAAAGSFNISFYASTNNIISTGDTLLGSTNIASLGAFNWANSALSTRLPVGLAPGTYYVGYIIDSSSSQTEFAEYNNTRLIPGTLSVNAIAPDRFEANDSLATATNFATLNGTRTENSLTIHATGNGDFYRFTAAANGTLSVNVSFTHANGDVDIQLLSAGGSYLTGSGSVTDTESFSYGVTRGTSYVLNVYGYSGWLSPNYNMTLTGPAIPADRFEANNTFATATDFGSLSTRTENDLTIHASGNGDYYKFVASGSGSVDASISFIHADGDVDMQLLNSGGTTVASSQGTSNSEHITYPVTSGQTYVLYVYGYSGSVNWDYDLTAAITITPQVLSQQFVYLAPSQRLTYQFSQNVSASLSTSDLTLQNLTTATTVAGASMALAYDSGTNTATFTFPGYAHGVLPDGNYRATLNAAGVTNSSGVPMSSDAVQDFFALAGDANHDRTVDISDLGILATNWQGSPRNFAQGDFNYDNVVDISDLGILATNWQVAILPPAAPVPPPQVPLLPGPKPQPIAFAPDPRINGGIAMQPKRFSQSLITSLDKRDLLGSASLT